MRIFTSYFYQIRFFDEDTFPLSTARFDPKWFHNFKDEGEIFTHKTGVLYGMKLYPLIPKETLSPCRGKANCDQTPDKCRFLKDYRNQLDKINFKEFYEDLENMFPDPQKVCLIFHEDPKNKCSERVVVQQWFRDNGVEILEWNRGFNKL